MGTAVAPNAAVAVGNAVATKLNNGATSFKVTVGQGKNAQVVNVKVAKATTGGKRRVTHRKKHNRSHRNKRAHHKQSRRRNKRN